MPKLVEISHGTKDTVCPFEKFTMKLLPGQRYEARGWFGGARPAPARVYEEPRQRGFFARLTR